MWLRKMLLPFSWLYGSVMALRNILFTTGLMQSTSYPTPVISVGNITVGGTGKTPLTEYLIRLLQPHYPLALLSRGYRRATKGPLLADAQSTAAQIGDEPFQIKSKFNAVKVAVAEKRILGMQLLLETKPTPVVIMDDAYQHRHVSPGFSILVIDYNRPLWKDHVFPAGNLREWACGQKRANVIVVNKCPAAMTLREKDEWLKKIKPKPYQQVYFSSIGYGSCQDREKKNFDLLPEQRVIAVAGIAKPDSFYSHVKSRAMLVDQLTFKDHHAFTSDEVINLYQLCKDKKAIVVTTEKDFVRLDALWPKESANTLYFIPIHLKVLFDEQERFDKTICNYVRDNQQNSPISKD